MNSNVMLSTCLGLQEYKSPSIFTGCISENSRYFRKQKMEEGKKKERGKEKKTMFPWESII